MGRLWSCVAGLAVLVLGACGKSSAGPAPVAPPLEPAQREIVAKAESLGAEPEVVTKAKSLGAKPGEGGTLLEQLLPCMIGAPWDSTAAKLKARGCGQDTDQGIEQITCEAPLDLAAFKVDRVTCQSWAGQTVNRITVGTNFDSARKPPPCDRMFRDIRALAPGARVAKEETERSEIAHGLNYYMELDAFNDRRIGVTCSPLLQHSLFIEDPWLNVRCRETKTEYTVLSSHMSAVSSGAVIDKLERIKTKRHTTRAEIADNTRSILRKCVHTASANASSISQGGRARLKAWGDAVLAPGWTETMLEIEAKKPTDN